MQLSRQVNIPLNFRTEASGNELKADSIGRQWQADAEPWEHKPFSHIQYRVTVEDCRRLAFFKSMDRGGWYVIR